MKRWICSLLIAITLSWIASVRTDGFSPAIIQGPLLTECAPAPTAEINAILSQPFHYLSKGRQCFVFESEDGKYVLKFFNQKYLKMPWYSFFIREKEHKKRALRRHFYENSYSIAYRELGDEILYLHLGPSEEIPQVALTDRASQKHRLDLSQMPFLIQKRGESLSSGLSKVYEKEGSIGLKREIDSFLTQVGRRIAKNIADADRDVLNNWGYVDGHIFHLDPGRLYIEDLSDPIRSQEEWTRATHDLHRWLLESYPESADYLASKQMSN